MSYRGPDRDDVDRKRSQWQVDYDRVQHGVYQRGRALDPRVVRQWMDAVAEHALPGTRRVVDVGAGTGRFAAALAERLDASVIGVEPSMEMLKRAVQEHPHPRVSYVAGRAEAIPVASATIDLAFVSMVVHHLDDLSAAVAEFARVTRAESVVVFRNVFRGRMEDVPLFRYFPRALTIENTRAPDVDELATVFARHGFRVAALESVRQVIDPTLAAYLARLSQRALSVFEFLTEGEIVEGLAMLESEASSAAHEDPVEEPIDLLVLRR